MPLVQMGAMSSKRKTEPMLGPDGLLRDTVRDLLPPPAAPAPESGVARMQAEPARDAGTELSPQAKGKPVVASDRKVSMEGFVPRSAVPANALGPKVDVSRVDPRRAPTQKIQRPYAAALDPASEGSADALDGNAPAPRAASVAAPQRRTRGAEPMWVVLAVLFVGAVALVGALAWRLSASQSAVPREYEGGVK
jgi:hypothetical protein